jgi:hypothetical protein
MNAPDRMSSTAPSSDAPDAAGVDQNGPVEPPEAYVIPRALAQATLDYLATHPYREVFALVRAFESLEPLPPRDPDRPA